MSLKPFLSCFTVAGLRPDLLTLAGGRLNKVLKGQDVFIPFMRWLGHRFLGRVTWEKKSRVNNLIAIFFHFIQCDTRRSFFSAVFSRSSVYPAVAVWSNSFTFWHQNVQITDFIDAKLIQTLTRARSADCLRSERHPKLCGFLWLNILRSIILSQFNQPTGMLLHLPHRDLQSHFAVEGLDSRRLQNSSVAFLIEQVAPLL